MGEREPFGYDGREDRSEDPAAGVPLGDVPPENGVVAQPPLGTVADWRSKIVTASGLNMLAGTWLIISPFVLGYEAADAFWNPILFGAIVLVLAVTRAVLPSARTWWMSTINAVIGVWLFLSAFWLASTAVAVNNMWITGLIVLILAVWSGTSSGLAPGSRRAG